MLFLLKSKYPENNLKINIIKKKHCHYDGRKYDDYLKFKMENSNIDTVKMDTVY